MAVKDPGPLSWNIPIVDVRSGRPSPEFQRRWETQRANFGLIGTITFGSGVPTGTPQKGAQYADISVTPYVFYIGNGNTWHQTGPKTFTNLTDVPASYTAQGSKVLRVNAGATAVEFVTESTVLDSIGSVQGNVLYRNASSWVPLAPGTAGQVLTSGGPAANVSWAAGGGGGGQHKYEAFGAVPLAADFTAVNNHLSTLTDGSLNLFVSYNGVAGAGGHELWVKTAPAPPYDVYMRAKWWASNDDAQCCLVIRNSGTGGFYQVGRYVFNSGFGHGILLQYFTNPTTFGGSSSTWTFPSAPDWFRISNDGTNLKFYISADGTSWSLLNTLLLSSLLITGDQVGFAILPCTAGTALASAWIGSFGTTAPT